MIGLDKCREILSKGERRYNSEQIKMLREYLYLIGQFDIESKQIKTINNECNFILSSEYRRAS